MSNDDDEPMVLANPSDERYFDRHTVTLDAEAWAARRRLEPCSFCHATGFVNTTPCQECRGTGELYA